MIMGYSIIAVPTGIVSAELSRTYRSTNSEAAVIAPPKNTPTPLNSAIAAALS